jgi:hypothetical protein
MKNKKMISKLVLPIIGGAVVMIMSIFSSDLRIWLMDHWRVLVFLLGLFIFSLAIITLWIRSVFNDLWDEQVEELQKRDNSINDNFGQLNKRIDTLTDLCSLTSRSTGITQRISLDFIYKELNEDSLINSLLDREYIPADIKTFGFDIEFRKKFSIKAHEREIEKTKNIKPDTNEPYRDFE